MLCFVALALAATGCQGAPVPGGSTLDDHCVCVCVFIYSVCCVVSPGWGELPSSVQAKSEPAWGEPAAPSSAVDNGTSAWGKPPAGMGSWADGGTDPSGPYGRSQGPPGPAPCKLGEGCRQGRSHAQDPNWKLRGMHSFPWFMGLKVGSGWIWTVFPPKGYS